MQKITSTIELKNAISLLEQKRTGEGNLIKQELHDVYESLKPVNLIKNTFNEFTAMPEFKDNVLNATLGLVAGYIAKTVMVRSTHNPFKKLFGIVLEIGVAKIVAKNSEGIKSTGLHLIKKIFSNTHEKNISN